MTLNQLQKLIDTDRINSENPIDLTSICNTGIFEIRPDQRQFGIQLTDEGADSFKAKINIEVQHASELVIAAIERNGGVVRTAYYDPQSLVALTNPKKWFAKGVPIPLRMLPPQDAIEYYTNPKNRGYLANPEDVSRERLVSLLGIKENMFFFLNNFICRFLHKNTVMSFQKLKTIKITICYHKLRILVNCFLD